MGKAISRERVLTAKAKRLAAGRAGPLRRLVLSLHDQAIEIRYPARFEGDIRVLFGSIAPTRIRPSARISIRRRNKKGFSIELDGERRKSGLKRGELLTEIAEEVIRVLALKTTSAVALHAGAVGWNGQSIIFPGPSGVGKSSLAAWFTDKGFSYLSDELCTLDQAGNVTGFARGLALKPGADKAVLALASFSNAPSRRVGSRLTVCPPASTVGAGALPCGLIVFSSYKAGAQLSITPVSAGKASLMLMASNHNSSNLADGGLAAIGALTRRVPAVELCYGDFEHLETAADDFAKLILDGGTMATRVGRLLRALKGNAGVATAAAPRREPPAPTPRKEAKRLTIGMATYDDYDGVYFSLQALRLYHPEILDKTEFVVVDNHPEGPCGQALKDFEKCIPNYRYVPVNDRTATAIKQVVFEEASGDFVLCIDSHVMVEAGALKRLLNYFDKNEKTDDLLQGPMIDDDRVRIWTHWRPEWTTGRWGEWDNNGRADDANGEPFDIPMMCTALFGCRRAAWQGFNTTFRGWGGEEGYIHEKFRQAGGRTLCLPFLRWMHRFHRPMGIPYPFIFEDRIFNYTVGFRELGLPLDEMQAYYRKHMGKEAADDAFRRVEQELEDTGHELRAAPLPRRQQAPRRVTPERARLSRVRA